MYLTGQLQPFEIEPELISQLLPVLHDVALGVSRVSAQVQGRERRRTAATGTGGEESCDLGKLGKGLDNRYVQILIYKSKLWCRLFFTQIVISPLNPSNYN